MAGKEGWGVAYDPELLIPSKEEEWKGKNDWGGSWGDMALPFSVLRATHLPSSM